LDNTEEKSIDQPCVCVQPTRNCPTLS